MSHRIQAFLGTRTALDPIQRHYGVSRVIALEQGVCLLPLIDELYDAIPDATSTVPVDDRFKFLTPKIAQLLITFSEREIVAYVETDYSGGTGSQGAILARAGKIVCGPDRQPGSINAALKLMSVQKQRAQDLFAAVGLNRYRSNEAWLHPPDDQHVDAAPIPGRPGPTIPPTELVSRLRQATGIGWLQARLCLALRPAVLSERIILAKEKQLRHNSELNARIETAAAQQGHHILRDPIEDEPALAAIMATVKQDAEEAYRVWLDQRNAEYKRRGLHRLVSERHRGGCHIIWRKMKKDLREKHGVQWFSPADLNPGVRFD